MSWLKWLALATATLALLAALVSLGGAWRWSTATAALHARLDLARVPAQQAPYHSNDLDRLPAPVQRYLRAALHDGQPLVREVHLSHTGSFDTGANVPRWRSFRSSQRVVIHRPGFVWNARVVLVMGVAVNVHDAYVAGEGILEPAILGLFALGEHRGGGEIARGELLRFLAEAAWYPTALLPSEGVRWEPIDDRSARATLVDGDVSVALVFHFNEHDLIDSVHAEARERLVGDHTEQMPWQGRFWNYAVRDGMRVPLEGEVSWVTPQGNRPYWRGKIQSIGYEFAQ